MKVLKYIVIAVLALFATFFMVGMLNPTFDYSSSIEVNAPVEKSWQVFMDESRLGDWLEGFESITPINETEGIVGSTYRVVFNQNDDPITMTETVSDYEENSKYALLVENEDIATQSVVYFERNGDKTIIRSENTVNPKGLMNQSVFYLFKSVFQNHSDKNYENLKRIIESQQD